MPSMCDVASTQSQYQHQLKQLFITRLLSGRPARLKETVIAVLGLNLDPIRDDLIALYSKSGHGNPHDPMTLFRSLLLMLALGETSVNKWVALVRGDDTLARLCGWNPEVRETPGVGTVYRFIDRIVDGPEPSISSSTPRAQQRIKRSTLRQRSRGRYLRLLAKEKEELRKEKPPEGRINAAAKSASALMKGDVARLDLPHRLNQWLFKLVVVESFKRDLFGDLREGLHISADGSVVASQGNGRGHAQDKETEARLAIEAKEKAAAAKTKAEAKAILDAAKKDKDTRPRFYSDLDATWIWSKHKNSWFFGHRLHVLMHKNGSVELPLYVSANTANMADGEMAAFDLADLSFALKEHLPQTRIGYFIADTGYDAVELYRMCMDHDIVPVISLHPNSERLFERDGIKFSKDGRPLCRGGLEMRDNGYNPRTRTHAMHCGIKRATHVGGKYKIVAHLDECPLGVLCDESKMGPFVHIAAKDDPRRHTRLLRSSNKFKKIYEERTATERFFGHAKENDGRLGKRPYRMQHMYALMGVLHAILIHRRKHVVHDFGDVRNDPEAYARALASLTAPPAESIQVPA